MRPVISSLFVLIAPLLLWTSQAAWGRIETGDTRFKFGLLGMQKIVAGPPETIERCGWYDAPPVAEHCRPTTNDSLTFFMVQSAPVAAAIAVVAFLMAAFAHMRIEHEAIGSGPAAFALVSAVALGIAILLLTRNVPNALLVYANHTVEQNGSGLTAAWFAALLLLTAAALSRFLTPHRR